MELRIKVHFPPDNPQCPNFNPNLLTLIITTHLDIHKSALMPHVKYMQANVCLLDSVSYQTYETGNQKIDISYMV